MELGYEELQNIYNQTWTSTTMFGPNRDNEIKKVADESAKIYESSYEGSETLFHEQPTAKIDWKIKSQGTYSELYNQIKENPRLILNSEKAFLTAVHEGIHCGQAQMRKTLGPEHNDRMALIHAASNEKARNTFDIPTISSTYIAPNSFISKSADKDLRDSWYRLQLNEREAFNAEIKAGEKVGINVDLYKENMNSSIQHLKEHYAISGDAEQVLSLVDKAQLNVAKGQKPTNATEASMTYDAAALMAEQTPSFLSRFPMAHNYMDPNVKAKKLASEGYEFTHVLSIDAISEYDLKSISNLSQTTIDQSPAFTSAAIATYGDEMKQFVNFDSFNKWYFSEQNGLSEAAIDKIAEVLGPEYSLESIDMAIENGMNEVDINLDEIAQETDFLMGSMEQDLDINALCSQDEEFLQQSLFDLGLSGGSEQGLEQGLGQGLGQDLGQNAGEEALEAIEEAAEAALETIERVLGG